MRRLLASLIALLAWAGGHWLLFAAGGTLQRAIDVSGAGGGSSVAAVPLAIGGALLVGVAALTSAWSSLATIVLGVVQTLVGGVVAIVPPGGLRSRNVVGDLVGAVAGWGDVGSSASVWLVSGACLIEGAVLLVLGIAAARRRRGLVVQHPAIARVVSLVATLIGLLPVSLLALHGGALQETALYSYLAGPSVLGIVLLGVGVAGLVLLSLGTRWSGLGAVVAGALLFLATGAANLIPSLLPQSARLSNDYFDWRSTITGLPRDVQLSLTQSVSLGTLTVLGAIFLLGGVASAIAGRAARQRHRTNYIEPGTGELEQHESPFGIFTP